MAKDSIRIGINIGIPNIGIPNIGIQYKILVSVARTYLGLFFESCVGTVPEKFPNVCALA